MFQIKAPETFPATLVLVGQGREQKLKLVFRHRDRDEYLALLDEIREGRQAPADALLELIESWEADMPLTSETLAYFEKQQPGVQWAIVNGYGASLAVARKGN